MKIIVRHRFKDYEVRPDTEILIVGTFNPDTPKNDAEFFYGRSRNYLWRLLPTAYQHADLKGKGREGQEAFINENKISFTDLIASIEVDEGKEADYSDAFIDKNEHIKEWNDIKSLIERLPKLRKVVVTRMTYADVPNIKMQVDSIEKLCSEKGIAFACLPTPARFYNEQKQSVWSKALAS